VEEGKSSLFYLFKVSLLEGDVEEAVVAEKDP
jgi:hypothetical protein